MTTKYPNIEKLKEKYKDLIKENNISIYITNFFGNYGSFKFPKLIWFNIIILSKGIYDEMDLEELEFCLLHEIGHAIIEKKWSWFDSYRNLNKLTYEFQADEKAVNITENKGVAEKSLEKFFRLNKRGDSPELKKRIERLRKL